MVSAVTPCNGVLQSPGTVLMHDHEVHSELHVLLRELHLIWLVTYMECLRYW